VAYIKVLTNERKGGLKVVSFVGLPLSYSAEIFKEISAGPILREA
jgi:hypothetical protein